MFGIGFTEMVLIGGIALIVIGPEKFPDFAKLVVRTIRDLRGYVDEVKTEVSRELKPLQDEYRSLSRIDPEDYIDSLTREAPSSKRENPALHEEDQKIMDEAGTYGEDPYGWEGDEEAVGGYDSGGDAPAETVAYGEGEPDAAPEAGDASDASAAADTPEGEDDREPPEGTVSADPDYAAFDDAIDTDGNNEPDVWTGR